MEAKHTPGPWETSSNAKGQWDICGPDAGDMIVDLKDCENAEANARLIAAAPDLLNTLEWALEQLNKLTTAKYGLGGIAIRERLKETIAKAQVQA
jgi:hypothetical protein